MKCARCNRPLTKSAAQYGKQWIGPKCLEKMRGKRWRRVRVEVVDSVGQMDLFHDLESRPSLAKGGKARMLRIDRSGALLACDDVVIEG